MRTKRAKASRLPHQRRSPRKGTIRPAASIPVINPHAAGVDVGSVEHWVCVPEDSVPEGQSKELFVRPFGGFTADLNQLVEWMLACGIKTVAVEATGVYWIPLVQKLEAAHIEVIVCNARHLKNVPGRKTDVKDCQWIQQLHSYGLLSGSFRPTQDICALRSLMRHRDNLVESCGREVQHMQKALQQMNIHLHHGISDLDGATGLRILDAILAGERDPKKLVELRDEKCRKTTIPELEKALEGDWREEHLFVLEQSLQNYRHILAQVSRCDAQVEKALAAVMIPERAQPESPAPKNPVARTEGKRRKKRFVARKNGPGLKRDFTEELRRICGIDLTQIPGLNVLSVLIILSEIGLDMSRWPNAKAFCAWLGLCPGNKISGGKVLDSRTVHVINRVSILLRTLAPSIGKTDTWLGIFHRRMKGRLGPGGANTATARKLACLIYHLLRCKEDYIDVDQVLLLNRIRKHRIRRLQKLAEELGFQVTEKQQAA